MRTRPMIIALLLVAAPVLADDTARLQADLDALTDRDPAKREAALHNLLGISPEQLETLAALIKEKPPSPAVAPALHKAVIHVRVRQAVKTHQETGRGFLGIVMTDQDPFVFDELPSATPGVTIVDRLPGFVAFRYLQVGDVIVQAGTDRQVLPVSRTVDLARIISSLPSGEFVTLHVYRGPSIRKFRFQLDSMIRGQEGETAKDVTERATLEAQEYWDKHFAPHLQPPTI